MKHHPAVTWLIFRWAHGCKHFNFIWTSKWGIWQILAELATTWVAAPVLEASRGGLPKASAVFPVFVLTLSPATWFPCFWILAATFYRTTTKECLHQAPLFISLNRYAKRGESPNFIDFSEPKMYLAVKLFCDKEGERFIAIDGKSLKKSPSAWSLRGYPCEACDKIFTRCHTLHKHKKYDCKSLETEKNQRKNVLNVVKCYIKRRFISTQKNRC